MAAISSSSSYVASVAMAPSASWLWGKWLEMFLLGHKSSCHCFKWFFFPLPDLLNIAMLFTTLFFSNVPHPYNPIALTCFNPTRSVRRLQLYTLTDRLFFVSPALYSGSNPSSQTCLPLTSAPHRYLFSLFNPTTSLDHVFGSSPACCSQTVSMVRRYTIFGKCFLWL